MLGRPVLQRLNHLGLLRRTLDFTTFPLQLLGHRVLRARRQQAVHIQRATCFRAGAGQAFATERLHADYSANHVAVHIQVADLGGIDHLGDGFVDTRVHTEGQTVTAVVDLLQQLAQISTLVAHYVQYRAEDLALHLVEAVQLDQGWQHIGAALDVVTHSAGGLEYLAALLAHLLDVLVDIILGFRVDHRADIGAQALRVAQAVFSHGALEHVDHSIRHVFLHTQHAQCRAALTRAVEGRGHDIDHHLFSERRGVDDHAVEAAGFGDQRNGAALGIQATGEVALNDPGHFGGPGKHHATHSLVADQASADGFATARQQLHGAARYTGVEQNAHSLRSDQRRLFGRLGQHGVTGSQSGGDLTAGKPQPD